MATVPGRPLTAWIAGRLQRSGALDFRRNPIIVVLSGPLGTVAGLYETAFDLLASRKINGEWRCPKIVASTATVRRAETQIRNLFGRVQTAACWQVHVVDDRMGQFMQHDGVVGFGR